METNIATQAVQSAVKAANDVGFFSHVWTTIGGWPGFWSFLVALIGKASGLVKLASLAVRAIISVGLLWFFSHNGWVWFAGVADFWLAAILMIGLGMIGAWFGSAVATLLGEPITAFIVIVLLFVLDVLMLVLFPAWILPGYDLISPFRASLVFTIFNIVQFAVAVGQA